MKLSQLTEAILPKERYKIYLYRKGSIPIDTPEHEILKRKPDYTLETQAISPAQAKNNAAVKYFREIRRQSQIGPFAIEKFHRTFHVIAQPAEMQAVSPKPSKPIQGTLF